MNYCLMNFNHHIISFTVMNAQIVPINPELISTITFPEDFHTQITIPANAIIFQRSTEGTKVKV